MSLPMAPDVAAVFEAFPKDARTGLLNLRKIIFKVAGETAGVGPVKEALRWGQPAYLTTKTRSGTTIRLGVPKLGGFALYVHCQTTLIENFRPLAPVGMAFEGRRAVLFKAGGKVETAAISILIARALTYHRKGLFVG